MSFRTRLSLLFAALGLILSLTASACTAPQGPAGGVLLIGAIAPLTGPNGTMGSGAKMGANLAAKEINASGGVLGKRLEIVFRDDEGNSNKAVQVAQELISNLRVRAILGPINTPNALAIAPILNDARTINLTLSTGTATVDPTKFPYIFRAQYYAWQEAETMLKYFLDTKGFTRLAILADSTGYGQGGVAELTAQLKTRGLTPVAIESYNPGDTDMTGQVARLINAGAQGILAWGLGHDLAQAAKALNRLGSKIPMIGASGITMVGFRNLGGEAAKDHYGVYVRRFTFVAGQPRDPNASDFVAKLDREYGTAWDAQTVVSAPWYEMVYLYAEAVNRAGTDNPDRVKAELEKLNGFPSRGIYTTYSFSADNHNGFNGADLTVVYAAREDHGFYERPQDAP
jgi:branched-chain amino acid transport system substrate-binding protein